jgi:hypothetical protein
VAGWVDDEELLELIFNVGLVGYELLLPAADYGIFRELLMIYE